MHSGLVDGDPGRAAPSRHVSRVLVVTVLVLVLVGLLVGSAVGSALSWVVVTALGGVGS